ncbi:MAG TPA: allantoate amidohydrolase [Xanthobacteraceae bacterium]
MQFGDRILKLADRLGQWSDAADGLTCTYLSPAHRAVAVEISSLMQSAGLETHMDPAANVVGRYPCKDANARTVIVGSHYDTVTNAGKYDGRLGILTGLLAAEHFVQSGKQLPFHLDVIAFSEEEGVRFAAPYIGSSAIAGRFDAALLDRRDAKGISLAEALCEARFDPKAIPALARRGSDVCAYIEVHIEQGPVLLQSNLPVGIVTAIAGNSRFGVVVDGTAGHAGTAPMNFRHDAAAAAAEAILAVERRCSRPGLLGTVGRLSVPAGAINVIPSRCELSIDIRADDDELRHDAVKDVLAALDEIAERRGVRIKSAPLLDAPAVQCSPRLQDLIAQSIEQFGVQVFRLASGAGHDAVMLDGLADIAMLFVRCGNGGVSHSPLETVTATDADLATRILIDVLEQLPP